MRLSLASRQNWLIILVTVLIIISILIYKKVNRSIIVKNGTETYCRFIEAGKFNRRQKGNTKYIFEVNGKALEYYRSMPYNIERNYIKTPEGTMLQAGDEFRLFYLEKNPDRHIIQFEKPSAKTLNRYFMLAYSKLADKYEVSDTGLVCLIRKLYQSDGIRVLADIHFMDEKVFKNLKNNRSTYKELTRSKSFKEFTTECGVKILE